MTLSKDEKNISSNYIKNLASAKWEYLKGIADLEKAHSLNEEELGFFLQKLNPAHVTTKRSTQLSRYSIGASFRISLVHYMLEKSFYNKKNIVAPGANDKLVDGRFLSKLGYPIPKIYNENASLEDVEGYSDCVVKAKIGAASKGVFKKNNDTYYHFFDKKEYAYSEFCEYSKTQKFNSFIVEEYIGSDVSVRDIKFYMFYGDPGVVLEVERSKDGNKHCFYNSNSEIVETGRYSQTLFRGKGFNEDILKAAKEISELIPSPFIRVDFIVDNDSYKIGELTAHPGGFEDFNQKWDFYLGKKFIKAKARLFEDLLDGKDFGEYINRYKTLSS